jgi:hypothetical protein
VKTERADEAVLLVQEVAVAARIAGELPAFFAELERVRMECLLAQAETLAVRSPSRDDRVLSTAETAIRVGRSAWWVRQNKDTLPIVRLPSGRYGFSERGLERWMERRASG